MLISESELGTKYPAGTPDYQKEAVEYFRCTKHGKKTAYLRDEEMMVHADFDDECA